MGVAEMTEEDAEVGPNGDGKYAVGQSHSVTDCILAHICC